MNMDGGRESRGGGWGGEEWSVEGVGVGNFHWPMAALAKVCYQTTSLPPSSLCP